LEYTKPHLTYEEQLGQLESRGLACADREEATGVLRTVGYYRFSAYAYPFRELLPPEAPRESEVQYRSDVFQPGSSFSAALDLYRFDHKLRMLTFEGLRSLELTLRVRIAYVLGKRDIFGHVRPECLNLHGPNARRHEQWVKRYREHVDKASSKDFVKHFLGKYEGDLPIWVAMEVVDFGSLSTLFRLLDKRDKNEIAGQFGLRNGGDRLEKWLQHLNNVRNGCGTPRCCTP
jgi:abortive infection bacteriophage resistance protein